MSSIDIESSVRCLVLLSVCVCVCRYWCVWNYVNDVQSPHSNSCVQKYVMDVWLLYGGGLGLVFSCSLFVVGILGGWFVVVVVVVVRVLAPIHKYIYIMHLLYIQNTEYSCNVCIWFVIDHIVVIVLYTNTLIEFKFSL